MIAAWLVTLALASPQEVAELEWARMPPVMLAPHATDPDAETRRSAARALGRLRVQAALPFLDALGDDPDALVRLQAAEAMALTPGSGPRLRAWLDRVPVSLGIAGHAGDATGLRVTLVEGLGHNGGPDDIDQLSALIAEPWPYSAAAARALGRLGRRDVHGVHRAVDPLVRALAR
ncbi:MAG: HEAT repeat protein, partial [Myxococcota bacterium]